MGCPFCALVAGRPAASVSSDLFYEDADVIGFIAANWWPGNPGHAIVIPRRHFENIYSLPEDLYIRFNAVARQVLIAMKEAYSCAGTSSRQHNEAAGGQSVPHYHVNCFPRWDGDRLYERYSEAFRAPETERAAYALRLRRAIDTLFGSSN